MTLKAVGVLTQGIHSTPDRRFEILKKGKTFTHDVKEFLGEKLFKYTISEKDRTCEVLLANDRFEGLIAYKKDLQGRDRSDFEVKLFLAAEDNESTYQELLARIRKLAKRMHANSIQTRVSNDLSLAFLKKEGFKKDTTQTEGKNQVLYYSLLNQDEQVRLAKKKRAIDKVSDAEEGNDQPLKRRKVVPQKNGEKQVQPTPTDRLNPPLHVQPPMTQQNGARVKQHFLPMKGEIFLRKIMDGTKRYEGRIYRATCKKMQVGDELKLYDNRAGWGILCKITSVDVYNSFQAMLDAKGILVLLPQLEQDARALSPQHLMQKAVKIYEGFPGSEGIHTDGVAAIGVKFIKTI